MYSQVKTFSDLLETNLQFFRKEVEETYYYCAKWGEGEDQNDHALVATDNLIRLTRDYRVFTTNGQSSYSDWCTDQRSYLFCYLESETFNSVKQSLLQDPRIWAVFITREQGCLFPKYTEISSLPSSTKRIVLTLDDKQPYSVWRRDNSIREEYESTEFPKVNEILHQTVFCVIIRKEWNKRPNADEVLLEHLEKA